MFVFRKNGHFYEKVGKKGEPLCIDDEIPFEIPKNWIWYRLNVFANIIMGQSPKGEFVVDNGEGIEFHQGKIFFGEKFLNKSDKGAIKPSKLSPKNSILLCVRAPVGVINICDREICIGRGLTSIKPFIDDCFNYLYYFLLTQEIRYKSKATGSTFKAIKKEIVENTLIPVPPLNEQIRIIDKIEALLPLIYEYGEKEERLNQLNKDFPNKLRNSILQEAIQGKLIPQNPNDEPASVLLEKIREEKERLIKEKKIKRNKNESIIYNKNNHYYEIIGKKGKIHCIDDEIPFDIPNNWNWVKLNNICNYGNFLSIDSKNIADNDWVLDLKDIEKDTGKLINFTVKKEIKSKSKKFIFKRGDVLYSKLRPYLNKVIIAKQDGYCTTEILPLKFYNSVYNYYVQIVLMSPYFVNYAIECSYGTKMPRLGTSDGKNAFFPLPPSNEQIKIVNKVKECFNIIDSFNK